MANLIHRRQSQREAIPPESFEGGRWDPMRALRDLMRWDPFRSFERAAAPAEVFAPDFEVKETAEAYEFRVDLPGVKEEDIEVTLTPSRLSIAGKREEEHRNESDTYYTVERSYGSFSRSFAIPDGVDSDDARADLKDGVLSLSLPKKGDVKAKKVPIGKHEKKQIKA